MAAVSDFQAQVSDFMMKVNGTGCHRAAWGQLEWKSLTYPLHFIGVMQAVDGGQLLHGRPCLQCSVSTSVLHHFVFPASNLHSCTAAHYFLLKAVKLVFNILLVKS